MMSVVHMSLTWIASMMMSLALVLLIPGDGDARKGLGSVGFTAPCDDCGVIAVVLLNSCEAADAAIDVDWGTSRTGLCRQFDCSVDENCINNAVFTISLGDGLYLAGPTGCVADDGDLSWTDPVFLCGTHHQQDFTVHGGFPCAPANKRCFFRLVQKCTGCQH